MNFLLFLLSSFYYSVTVFAIAVYTLGLGLLFWHREVPRVQERNLSTPSVSLVIPTYNEASIIARKLDNVLSIDYPRDVLEVVVVDSASTDETRSIVRRFAEEHAGQIKVRLIEQQFRRGKSEALNEAIKNVRSEILVLTDADVTFPPNSLSRLVENLDGSEVGAVSGVEVPVGDKSFLSNLETGYRRVYTAVRLAEANLDAPFMCESELSAYRTAALEPLPPGTVCDDLELTVGVRKKGLGAVYASNVPFFETEAGKLGPKLSHKLRRGMNNQHALLQNWRLVFGKNLGKYGSIVFPFEFFVHILSPILLTISLVAFLGMAIVGPLSAAIALLVTVVLSLPILSILQMLVKRYQNVEVETLQGPGSWPLGALAFLAFQLLLFVGLLKLVSRGPQANWQQIPGTRVPVVVEATA